jgi:hypothetical protein
MSADRGKRVLVGGALLLAALALGGCSTSVADLPLFGNASDTRTKDAGGFLPVGDLPPNRDETAIAPDEQAQIKAELLAARDRQASAAAKDPNNPANQPNSATTNR